MSDLIDNENDLEKLNHLWLEYEKTLLLTEKQEKLETIKEILSKLESNKEKNIVDLYEENRKIKR